MTSELEFWPRFVLCALATWRVSHLLAHEDGPADLVLRLRALAGNGFLGRMLDCIHCLSLWIAVPFALVLVREPLDRGLAWLALSGAASLAARATDPALQRVETRGEAHGMLWTRPDGAESGERER